MDYQERLLRAIPGGSHTYSRGFDQFPSNAPQILERGQGAYVWDPEGRRFLDYGMGLRAVTLGYAYPSVAEAAYLEAMKGNNLPRASVTELEAAELIVNLIPGADMVKFAKNGSNVTTAATKVARAYTGRPYIAVPRQHPFFSFDDWFIGSTPLIRGIPAEHAQRTLVFDYNDIGSLKALFDDHPGQIAGVILEPATTLTPCPHSCARALTYDSPCHSCIGSGEGFLHEVQALCRRNETLFILDEMITGFRWHLQGAQTYFGVEPDLSTFGKGMANGFSVAALVGRREIMDVGSISEQGAERTFLLSSTHGGEMSSLRAFIETVNVYKEESVCQHHWCYGQKLRSGLESLAAELGIADHFSMDGPAISMNYCTRDPDGSISMEYRTLFAQEMVRNGVLMSWVAVSLSHGDTELQITLEAARDSLLVYRKALDDGIEKYLRGPAVKPVFRKYN
ncbi:MAG: glutamate-1-semialdehyde 2,1-aminomutase [Rhodobacteraceae bacterium]|nr:glutamate-1-semialdehyde 2,1-aminomutase [Paracoccaceae bacterium]